ncbi:MAG: hypothetical protein U0835_20520 [Isosphaeraceae bacterium]
MKAAELKVTGSMMAILNEAIHPDLVQSREGSPRSCSGRVREHRPGATRCSPPGWPTRITP